MSLQKIFSNNAKLFKQIHSKKRLQTILRDVTNFLIHNIFILLFFNVLQIINYKLFITILQIMPLQIEEYFLYLQKYIDEL